MQQITFQIQLNTTFFFRTTGNKNPNMGKATHHINAISTVTSFSPRGAAFKMEAFPSVLNISERRKQSKEELIK